jgi:hypothetical protein
MHALGIPGHKFSCCVISINKQALIDIWIYHLLANHLVALCVILDFARQSHEISTYISSLLIFSHNATPSFQHTNTITYPQALTRRALSAQYMT